MRLPFLSKVRREEADNPEAGKLRVKQTKSDKATSRNSKAQRKKASFENEQEKRRQEALAKWETALQQEVMYQLTSANRPVNPRTVTSANGRLEHSGSSSTSSHSRKRSRRFLDVDNLDELESCSSDAEREPSSTSTYDDGPDPVPAGPTQGMGPSHAAQLHQVACMRELPMLEMCAKRHAPSSFFVDMMLLGDLPKDRDSRAKQHRDRRQQHQKPPLSPRSREEKYAERLAKERASRSCPPRPKRG